MPLDSVFIASVNNSLKTSPAESAMLWSQCAGVGSCPEQDLSCSDCSKCFQSGTSAGSTFPEVSAPSAGLAGVSGAGCRRSTFPPHREPSPSPPASVTVFSSMLEKVRELKAKHPAGRFPTDAPAAAHPAWMPLGGTLPSSGGLWFSAHC